MLLMGGGWGGGQRLLFQIKKAVPIGDVVLNKNVPTPLPSAGTLGT